MPPLKLPGFLDILDQTHFPWIHWFAELGEMPDHKGIASDTGMVVLSCAMH